MALHPYKNQPSKKFWRSAIGECSYFDLKEVSQPIPLSMTDKVATAGSCFAQHIGRQLAERGANYMDLEVAPSFLDPADHARFGFGIYSARYGNVYTSRQLVELAREALGEWTNPDPVWEKEGRFYDSKRPSVDPVGYATAEEVIAIRSLHLKAVLQLLTELDVFVFTLGLTEAWQLRDGEAVYPMAPGVICGTYDPSQYQFVNYDFGSVYADLEAFHGILKRLNPNAKMILTVSPVPLAATASDDHVLVATVYSKSTLRSVAGYACSQLNDVYYFPSYEIISTHPSRGMFFNPDLRTVNQRGVNFVMEHFFTAISQDYTASIDHDRCEIVCDEERIEEAR